MSLTPVLRPSSLRRWSLVASLMLLLAALPAAQAPPGYYDTVDTTNGTTLRDTLHQVIDDHTRFPYTSGSTDTWDILEMAEQNPSNSGQIIDIYRNTAFNKQGGGNSFYNREHVWPKSYGFPDDGSTNYAYTDCHALHLCDDGYNSSRSNKPFDNCSASCSENTTVANNGVGGGSGVYPGNSNWTSGSFTTGIWEVWNERKGDIARTMLYLDVRYEGGTHNVTGVTEPDLILTDNLTLIASSNTGNNELVGYMGKLSVLLAWHAQDPPDAFEINRNNVVASFQGNRNPFVDHPEWVDCIFNGVCGSGLGIPMDLVATPGNGVIDLSWTASTGGGLAGYNVYRSTAMGGGYTQLNGAPIVTTSFSDTGVTNGTTYFYVVTAEDTLGVETGFSDEVSATPDLCTTVASATFRNGGANPASLTASAPVLGQMWTASVNLATTGHSSALIFGYVGQANITLSGGQVILADPGSSAELFNQSVIAGPIAQINLMVPNDPAICGATATAQAAHVGTVPVILFSNAIDMVAGL